MHDTNERKKEAVDSKHIFSRVIPRFRECLVKRYYNTRRLLI
jgi:hypothetical protein